MFKPAGRLGALVILHEKSEGIGCLNGPLSETTSSVRWAKLYAGERLPSDPSEWSLIVSMGGPMNVYEEDEYPFLREETEFLRRAIESDVPILGVCLGAQMIAKACGAKVVKSPEMEWGWRNVYLTEEGRRDPVFRRFPSTLRVFQWHEDMFELPEDAVLLATSDDCPNQAFRYRRALGLQFHVEITHAILDDWTRNKPDRHRVLSEFEERENSLFGYAARICRNLLSLETRIS
ncbi:MAG TPA: type 1 glutamine amidotransferase [Candidatus Brocadiia bacterium]|nr:type 1 glutamine amidotransferase [Candidatus Brocadiia bacterium]